MLPSCNMVQLSPLASEILSLRVIPGEHIVFVHVGCIILAREEGRCSVLG